MISRRALVLGAGLALVSMATDAQMLMPIVNGGGLAIAPVAASGVASNASLNFTVDNALVSAASAGTTTTPAGVYPPTSAFNTPATASNGWFITGFFYVPQNFQFLTSTETIACNTASNSAIAGGGNDRAIYLNQGNATSNATTLVCRIANAGVSLISTGALAVSRGKGYFFALGQTATNTFFFSLLDTAGNIVSNSSYSATGTINSATIFAALGCANMSTNVSHNPFGFSGCIQNWGCGWGVFPNTAGVPTASSLISLATGASTLSALVTSVSGTYRYFCQFAGPSGLAADGAGAITGTATAPSLWTQSATPLIGDPICPQPWLTLQPEGDNGYYVWGVNPGLTTGKVWFRGTYATSNGVVPTFEAQLTRVDNSAVYVAWTPLLGVTTTPTGSGTGTFSGYVVATAGVGFSRAVRYAGQSATACLSYEKHACGIVVFFHAQSQTVYYFTVGSQSGSTTVNGSGSAVQPVDTANAFACSLGVVGNLSDGSPTTANGGPSNGPVNDALAVRPLTANSYNYANSNAWPGATGDAIVAFTNKLVALSGYPVMVVNAAKGGHSPQNFFLDQQTATQTGSTASSTITLSAPTSSTWPAAGSVNPLGGTYGATTFWYAGSAGTNSPMIQPGTFSMVIGGVTVTDNGAGAIAGPGISGTINYVGTSTTYPSITISSGYPGNGTSFSATWTTNIRFAASQPQPAATILNYGNTGVIGSQHSGFIADVFVSLGKNAITTVAVPWWTTWLPLTGWTGGTLASGYSFASVYTYFDGVRAFLKQWPNVASAKFGFAPAAREVASTGSSEVVTNATFGGHRYSAYNYVKWNQSSGPNDSYLLADVPDTTIAANSGPHQDAFGGQLSGQRHAYAVAAALGFGGQALYSGSGGQAPAPVMGPVLTGVSRTSSTVLTLTFSRPNGTSLTAYNGGSGASLAGFELGTSSASQQGAYLARATTGFTAAIASANTVTITLSTGTWPTYISLSYCAGYNVFSGTANYAADAATIGTMLCDNSGVYTLPANGNGAGTPAGNAAAAVLDWAA